MKKEVKEVSSRQNNIYTVSNAMKLHEISVGVTVLFYMKIQSNKMQQVNDMLKNEIRHWRECFILCSIYIYIYI
jgi:hypothetical protein